MENEGLNVTASATESHLILKLSPPASGHSTVPTNVCIVMDASGSMNSLADVSGGEGSDGLTVLDMCKHACKCVIQMLGDQDTFALCSFADDAQVDINSTSTTAAAKSDLITSLERLSTRGRTNIWAGVEEGLKLMEAKRGQNNHLLLLTDGVPNVSPPAGEVQALQDLMDSGGADGLPCSIHMCGFGYNLVSKMLVSMAHVGGGSYSFVPDCSVLGSVFVNWTANVQTTMLSQVLVTVASEGGFARSELTSETLKSCVRKPAEKERTVELSSVSYDQSRYIALEIPAGSLAVGSEVDVKVEFNHWSTGKQSKMDSVKIEAADAEALTAPVRISAADVCLALSEAVPNADEGNVEEMNMGMVDKLRVLTGLAKSLGLEQHPLGEGLLQDLEGQMAEATSRGDWFGKWGRHYLPSLALAHWSQRSNNFKDGVQAYGSDMFNDIVDSGGDIFKSLELKASRQVYGRAAPASAATYYDPQGVCFAPESRVAVPTPTGYGAIMCKDVVKGMCVMCQDGTEATVLCVVRSPASGLVKVNGVRVTEWHPVMHQGEWAAARDVPGAVVDTAPVEGGEVWNFVLSNGHSVVLVGDGDALMPAATLGHNMDHSPVVAHAFFGTRAVVDALSGCGGWEQGQVHLQGVRRDCRTSQITGVVSA